MKKNESKPTGVFKIKFSVTIVLLCVAVYVLCAVGIGVSVWRIVRFGVKEFSDVLKYPFLILVCLLCIVLVTSILIKSQYAVDDKYFISQYGLVKSKFLIKDITSITLDTESKKLTVNFGEQFMVLSVSPDFSEPLVRALLAVKPDIDYGFTLAENKPTGEDENKK
ncbi:MAG: hypothetical protein IJX91_02110 [Clostridia bacterium]|nr:hypothetical protein [Clostridia bacterium]